MGEIIDFETSKKIKTEKTGREKFQEELRRGVPQIQYVPLVQNQREYLHNRSRETREEITRTRYEQTSRNERRKIKNVPSKQKINLYGNKKIVAMALAAVLAVGGIGCIGKKVYDAIDPSNIPITLEQAENMGETSEKLQISDNTLQEMQEIQEKLNNDDIDVNGLMNVGNQLYGLQLNVIKSKLASQIGIKSSNIQLHSDYDTSKESASKEYITILGEHNKREEVESYISEEKLPDEIKNYIQNVARTEINESNVANGEFNKSEVINAYKEVLDVTSKFAAGNLKVEFERDNGNNIIKDENGIGKVKKITFEQIKQRNLDKLQDNLTTKDHEDEER